jgi:hypothetical protein
MQSLSHYIGRLPGAAAFIGLAVLAAGPVHAATISATKVGNKMVSANNVKSVKDYLASKGDQTTQSESDVGNPMLTQADNLYDVYFDCDDNHTNCTAIQFRACYSDYPEADVYKTNALSRDFFFAKSYIDNDGYACLELPVATGTGGISYEAMDRAYDAFLWFRQNTDEQFGKPSS